MPFSRRRPMRAAVAAMFVPLLLSAGALPGAALAAGAATVAAAAPAVKENAAFTAWADQFAAQTVRIDPQLATRTQYFAGAEQDALTGN